MAETINVLHLGTHDEECGIAAYQESVIDSLGKKHPINNVFFDLSPNKIKELDKKDFSQVLKDLLKQLKDFDLLHIQLEFSFYKGDQLREIVAGAKSKHKKVLFTAHTPPHALKMYQEDLVTGLGPHSLFLTAKKIRAKRRFNQSFIEPLKQADMVIVLSEVAKQSFAKCGVPDSNMRIVDLPVPQVDDRVKSNVISDNLHKKPGDIILGTTGFLSKTKGITAAVKSLKLLPDNYKLAIVGGAHPSGNNDKYYDQVCDLIIKLDLRDRTYIAGYVNDENEWNALLRETDIVIYPYDKKYYDYVSSAALNDAVANRLPVVAYQTKTFVEANQTAPFITFSQSPNYYELARTIKKVDVKQSIDAGKQFAATFTVDKQASHIADYYQELTISKRR